MAERLNGNQLISNISQDIREIRDGVLNLTKEVSSFRSAQTVINKNLTEASVAATAAVAKIRKRFWIGSGAGLTLIGVSEAIAHFL